MNETESFIKEKYESMGYNYLKNGFPDFVFYREDNNGNILPKSIFFCEVKGTNDTIKLNQYKYIEILKSLGMQVKVEMVDFINTTTKNISQFSIVNKEIIELKKSGLTTVKIEKIIVKEKKLCSKASFYRYLKKLFKQNKEVKNE